MVDRDLPNFSAMLDEVCGLLSRGTYTPTSSNTAMWFRAMRSFDIAAVRDAFDAHVKDPQRGKFVPVPADLIAQIELKAKDDGRPGADEAWATAMLADNEEATLRWTSETAMAWGHARPVLQVLGDKVGARMAFRDVYERLVSEARARGWPVEWEESVGAGLEARQTAIALQAPDVLLLESSVAHASPTIVQRAFEAMARLRERLTMPKDAPSEDAIDKQRTAALRQEADEKTREYQREHPVWAKSPAAPKPKRPRRNEPA